MSEVVDRRKRKIQDAKEHQMKYFLKALALAVIPVITIFGLYLYAFMYVFICVFNLNECLSQSTDKSSDVIGVWVSLFFILCYIFSIIISIRNMVIQGEDRKIGYFIAYICLIIFCLVALILSIFAML